jgi:DNA (cytosine-5)-methyltransferase 1
MFTDVREVTRDALLNIGAEPTRTILTGGFPCQDLSGAGRRAGLAGPRSGLFYEVARIIDEFGPAFVMLENVCGLLSSAGGRDMGSVIGTLEELRYKWAYRVLDSKFYGVAQQRRRVFIAAVPRESRISPEQVLAIR